MSDATNDILAALVAATPERKVAALRALRGEFEFAEKTPVTEAYLTLRELGKRLGISSCSLWRYGVPGHELGGRRRFRMSEVEAYLASAAFKRRAEDLKEDRSEMRSAKCGTRSVACGVRMLPPSHCLTAQPPNRPTGNRRAAPASRSSSSWPSSC